MSRPSWDDTWMKVVNAIAERSNDETFKVGAVIVTRDNTQAIAIGYNGNAPGLPLVKESDEPGKSGYLHAEENAIIKMDFHHHAKKVLYVTLSPCVMCCKRILAARIDEVVYKDRYRDVSGLSILESQGVIVRQYVPQNT